MVAGSKGHFGIDLYFQWKGRVRGMEGGPDAAFIAYCYWLKITFPYLIPVLGFYQIYLITDTRRSLITFGGCRLRCRSGCGCVSNLLNCTSSSFFGNGFFKELGVYTHI